MQNVEIALPRNVADDLVAWAFDRAIVDAELVVTLRDTLKAFPGCIHWHVKKGRESGTLEITYWPTEHRAWFTVQRGRRALWIATTIKMLSKTIEAELKSG